MKTERESMVLKFREMLDDLQHIKHLIEKENKLQILNRTDIDSRMKDYRNNRTFGISEFYFHGMPSSIDWMIGIEIMNDIPSYVYEKLYILSPDDIHKFSSKDEFMKFLADKKLLVISEGAE